MFTRGRITSGPLGNIARTYFSSYTVYPKKYAHSFVVLCFVVVMQSFIMNSHEVFIHIHQGCFAGTRAIVRLPQCQWSKPDGYGEISQCITTTKHSKAKTVWIFLGINCSIVNAKSQIVSWLTKLWIYNKTQFCEMLHSFSGIQRYVTLQDVPMVSLYCIMKFSNETWYYAQLNDGKHSKIWDILQYTGKGIPIIMVMTTLSL